LRRESKESQRKVKKRSRESQREGLEADTLINTTKHAAKWERMPVTGGKRRGWDPKV